MLGNSLNIILPRGLSDCVNSVAYSNAVDQQINILYRNDPKFSDGDLQANLVDPDQKQSNQGLHCLLFRPQPLDAILYGKIA